MGVHIAHTTVTHKEVWTQSSHSRFLRLPLPNRRCRKGRSCRGPLFRSSEKIPSSLVCNNGVLHRCPVSWGTAPWSNRGGFGFGRHGMSDVDNSWTDNRWVARDAAQLIPPLPLRLGRLLLFHHLLFDCFRFLHTRTLTDRCLETWMELCLEMTFSATLFNRRRQKVTELNS